MSSISKKYFSKWLDIIAIRKYNEWHENLNEEIAESDFAAKNGMNSELWCWNCKHSECDIHLVKKIKTKCAGKTQRGRDCHIHASTYRQGMFFCKYHF